MTRYLIESKDRPFAKGYEFLSFAKNKSQNIGKSKKLSGKYSLKLLDHAKQSATDAFKTASKRAIQKTTEAAGDLTRNKITDKTIKVSRRSQQNNSEKWNRKYRIDGETLRERYISLEKSQKIIDDLRLI